MYSAKERSVSIANKPHYGGMKAYLVKTYPNGLKLKSDATVCHYDESTLLNIDLRVMLSHGSGNRFYAM